MKYLSTLLLVCGLVANALSKKHHHHNVAQVTTDPIPIVPRKFSGTYVTNRLNKQVIKTYKWDADADMVLTLVDDGFGSSEIRDKLVQGYASSPCLEGRSPFPYIPVAYNFYDEYLGVQKDPLGKTSEEYHVRQVIDYDTDGYYSEEIS